MDGFKKIRASCKAQLTRISNWYNDNFNTLQSIDKNQITNRIEILITNFQKYNETQDEIDYLADGDQTKDHEIREEFENKHFTILSSLQSIATPTQAQTSQNSSTMDRTNIRLPDIKIPTFSGNPLEYHTFLDLFNALIKNNPSLKSNAEKFFYLKSYLSHDALKLIEKLKVTDDNFQIALNLLDKRFNNKKQIINNHFYQILSCSTMTKSNAATLRKFSTEISIVLESLKNLNFTTDELFESLIIHILEHKLDFHTRKAFEEQAHGSDLPQFDEFFDFLEKRSLILENVLSPEQTSFTTKPKIQYSTQKNNFKPHSTTLFSQNEQSHKSKVNTFCSYCENSTHKIYTCTQFSALTHKDKTGFIKNKKLCFNCLGPHMSKDCVSNFLCSICKKRHHTLLHIDNYQATNAPSSSSGVNNVQNKRFQSTFTNVPSPSSGISNFHKPSQNVALQSTISQNNENNEINLNSSNVNVQNNTSLSAISINSSHILLATAQVVVFPKLGSPFLVKMLLDNGSQSSFITEHLVKKLGYDSYNHSLQISGILNEQSEINKMVDFSFSSHLNTNKQFKISCAIVNKITNKLPQVKIRTEKLQIPEIFLDELADFDFNLPSDIDILAGADIYCNILQDGFQTLGKDLPILINTHLGWILSGNVPYKCLNHNSKFIKNSQTFLVKSDLPQSDDTLSLSLEKFWSQEEIQKKIQCPPEDDLAEKVFENTTKILDNGKYQVNLPFKDTFSYKQLGDSFQIAKNRFFSLERKFEKDPSLHSNYSQFIQEYIHLGHGKQVPLTLKNSSSENKYFVPHLCVLREQSQTTKLRVVFDFSCKTSSKVSFNDISLKGPQVQPDLFDILCRFRLFKFVLTADIEKMYRQVVTNPEQNFLQNILWRNSPNENLKCIELSCISFGQTCAPFLATRVLKDIAVKNSHLSLASNALLSQTYVDDILSGTDTLSSLESLYFELKTLLANHGFNLHKLCSNSREFNKKFSINTTSEVDLNLNDFPCKVLGLKWHPNTDFLQISVPSDMHVTPVTKRKILSVIAQMYDPLGIINPIVVKGKILMQKLWLNKLNWDDEISDISLLKEWEALINNIAQLKNLKINRCIFSHPTIKFIELHGFSDASSFAYGGNIYFRTIYSNNYVTCTLISAKSKVAPLRKNFTIPKLELSAMLLLATLAQKILNIVQNNLNISSVNLWTDSQIALSWINSHPSRWNVFVSNRVSQIQELSKNYHWRHVKSKQNAADILSRGIFSADNFDVWFSGPEFLNNPNLNLDDHDFFSTLVSPPEERKSLLVSFSNQDPFWITMFKKCSSFLKLLRTVAYIKRFIYNLRNQNKLTGSLTIIEIDQSLMFIISQIQMDTFSNEIKSLKNKKILTNKQILTLHPFVDSEGILRVGGRLKYAPISYNQKHPILLPSKNHLVSLLLKHEHERLGHSGPGNVLSNVRLRYWPLNALREIKRIIHNCVTCHRFKSVSSQQLMADLPKYRVEVSRPFQKSGVDFGGPFFIKSSRLKRAPITKCYIAIFVCMSTKSVHIELVSDLTSEAFLATLQRTTGSPQAKSPAGSSQGALPPEARTPNASANKVLQNAKGDHPSVSQDMAFLQNRSISLVDMYIDNSEPSENVGQIHFSLEYDFQNTTLILRIIQGKELPAKDLSGTSDPYVRVTLLPDKKHRLETKIKRRTLNPRWNETFYFEGFPIQKLQSRVLHLHVFDYDRFSRDDSIGEVFLPLCQVDLSEKPSFWKALKPPAKDKCGELLTSLCYHPSNSILTLTLLKARNLKAKDINGKSDPYVKVWLQFGDKRIEKRKTAIFKCTLNPVFNDTFSFNVPWEKIRECSLDVMVMDFDNIGRNELIGRILLAGKNGSGASETKHWQDMITKPRQTIVQWHRLKPE